LRKGGEVQAQEKHTGAEIKGVSRFSSTLFQGGKR